MEEDSNSSSVYQTREDESKWFYEVSFDMVMNDVPKLSEYIDSQYRGRNLCSKIKFELAKLIGPTAEEAKLMLVEAGVKSDEYVTQIESLINELNTDNGR